MAGAQPVFLLLLERVIFGGLLALLTLSAIPYGTVEPWSEALFEAGVLLLTVLWLIHGLLSGSWLPRQTRLFHPLIALAIYALLQSLALWQADAAGEKVWYAISADAFETRRFVLKVASLLIAGILLARYTISKRRLSTLVHVIIIVAAASAMFGIVRQSIQHTPGFLLPFLKPGAGYAQFSNRNHFAFLMEMGMGLVAGLMAVRSKRRERLPLYLAVLLALWTALILSNSRGGLLAMIVQCAGGFLLFTSLRGTRKLELSDHASAVRRLARSFPARVALLGVVVAVVVTGVIWIGGDPLAASLEGATIEMSAADKTEFRVGARRRDIWHSTWLMFRAHPFAGAGFGGYWAEIPQYHDASGLLTPQQAHNDYLEILASGGVIGLAMLLWFLALLVKQARQALRSEDSFYNAICAGAIIGIVGVAVHSVFDFGLHITTNAFVFVALLAILSLEQIKGRRAASAGDARQPIPRLQAV